MIMKRWATSINIIRSSQRKNIKSMPLLDQLQKDLVAAMRAKDELRLGTIRMIKTALQKAASVDPSKPLNDAAELLQNSEIARTAFGPDVVEFYTHTARHEVAAFNGAVTDWERVRYFERI